MMEKFLQQPGMQKIADTFGGYATIFRRYRLVIFVIFVAILYGFVVYRINGLSNQQPSDTQVQATAPVPHIDQTVVQQLQSLQDHSVSVKALFDQARSNPFQ